MKTAEILEIICFGLFIFMPLWLKVPLKIAYADGDKQLFAKYLAASIISPFTSIFLLYQLNPLDIRNRIKKQFGRDKDSKNEESNNEENNS